MDPKNWTQQESRTQKGSVGTVQSTSKVKYSSAQYKKMEVQY